MRPASTAEVARPSLTRLGLQQDSLVWNPDMEEVSDRPPSMILIDNYFAVYR